MLSMKKVLRLALVFCLVGFGSVALPGCATPPSARVVQVQTLKAVGQTAEAAVALSARLYRDGVITPNQALEIRAFYDERFQPAFRLAAAAAQANLDSIASPDLAALAGQLAALVASYTPRR
jgi:hypothetical protein